MNIFQKIFKLQQRITMNKDKSAKNYIYRTLDDMLLYLKPHFNSLSLIGIFSDGTIEGNVKRICFTLYNIDEPTELFTISDSCIVDCNPKVMSPAQSANATDTFLQKRILEHLLLLTTEPDPDSIPLPEPEKSPIEIILENAEKAKMGTKEELLQNSTKFNDLKGYTKPNMVSDKVKARLLENISDDQVKRLMTIAGKKAILDDSIKALILKVWGKDSKKKLNLLEYNILVGYIESKPDAEAKKK
jgi:hypothetical protein